MDRIILLFESYFMLLLEKVNLRNRATTIVKFAYRTTFNRIFHYFCV